MTEILEAALGYARRGWPVFPCHPKTTAALVKVAKGEQLAASTDEAVIADWWQRWPLAMIGAPTGKRSGFCVVVVGSGYDEKSGILHLVGELMSGLEDAIGVKLPPTVTAASGSGNTHFYFKTGEALPARRSGIAAGVEIRGDGGYVVLPPSLRHDGKAYRWVSGPDQAELADAPAELIDALLKRGTFEKATKLKKAAKLTQVSEGPDRLREIARFARRRPDPDPHEDRGGAKPGKWKPDELGLPAEDPCPVTPLGLEGGTFYVLDSARQLRGCTANSLSHAGIQDVFAAMPNWPEWAWPRWSKPKLDREGEVIEDPKIQSFKDDEVRKGLFRACERKGLFSPRDKVRGRGAWRREDGGLVYHAGEELWTVETGKLRVMQCGSIEDAGREFIYPRAASLPAPWGVPVTSTDNPAKLLVEAFRRFNWERPDVDPILLLGWCGVAYLGGALDWRSAVFLVGDKNTGKSTLQEGMAALYGAALLSSSDTTAAGIYQELSHDARPVAVDEIEGRADNRKTMAVIELARSASSGAIGRRGGADHHGVEFQMRSAFLFSAINTPPLRAQDLSRLAMLRLKELPKDAGEPPSIPDPETVGRKLLARLMFEWPRFEGTLAAYKDQLAIGGHTSRGRDTYGTLLAAADLLLGPELAEELEIPMVDQEISAWSKLLAANTLPEVEDALPNWRACLNHLLTAQILAWRSSSRNTVGQLLEDIERPQGTDHHLPLEAARRALAQAGLGLLSPGQIPSLKFVLAIPNQSALVQQIYWGTDWQGAPGAGVWAGALRMGKDSGVVLTSPEINRVRINRVQERCTLVVLDRLDDAPSPDRKSEE